MMLPDIMLLINIKLYDIKGTWLDSSKDIADLVKEKGFADAHKEIKVKLKSIHMKWFIPGNVPSSKNGRRWTGKYFMSSKANY
jgi:hypothetical protein